MRTTDESRDPDSRWDDVEAERRAVKEDSRAVTRDIQPATLPHAITDIERGTERRRIALQILAVVVPWRDALPYMNLEECDLFRVRGRALLNYLDVAVMPYPDLQDALASARSELASERPSTGSQQLH